MYPFNLFFYTKGHSIGFYKYYYSTSFAIGQGFIEKNIRKNTIFFRKLLFFQIFFLFPWFLLPLGSDFYF